MVLRTRNKKALHAELDRVWDPKDIPDARLFPACLDSDMYRRLTQPQRALCDVRTRKFLAVIEILGVLNHVVTVREAVRVAFSCAILYSGRPEWEFPPHVAVRVSPVPFDKKMVPCPMGKTWGFVMPGTAEVWLSTAHAAFSFEKDDSYHVPIHEFAHVVDFGILERGRTADGIPRLLGFHLRKRWIETLERARKRIARSAGGGVLDKYAEGSVSETFACALEAFFERPRDLRAWDADFYRQIADFLQQDPAAVR